MVTFMLRGLAAALVVLSTTISSPAHAAESLPLTVERLPLGTEAREGYTRDSFRHWNAGEDPTDGCHTRAEVLLRAALESPTVGAGCRIEGGGWFSYYDGVTVTSASGLDIDHMVPWPRQRRLGVERAAP